jgi:EmrB/QacA subfamily drug resistance transporter
VLGFFMSILDVTIVNVAVPAIQHEFGGSLDDVLWIATAYTLTLGVVVPLSGWLGDKVGLVRLYVGSLVAFAGASGLCGLAWSLDSLIVFRIVQAVPGGILPVASLTLLYRIVPPAKVGVAMGVYGFGAMLAPAVGPVLGGYFVDHLSWRLVFDINVPVGLLTALGAYLLLPGMPGGRPPRFDQVGFVTVALGLAAVLLAASKGDAWGWDGYRIRMLIVGGALLLALFVVVELQVDHPLLDVRLLGIGQFSMTLFATTTAFTNLLVGTFYLPVFLQHGQGYSAFDSGRLILPQALVMCVTIPLSGILYDVSARAPGT